MTLRQLRKDMKGLKEKAGERPFKELLASDPKILTDQELDRVINEAGFFEDYGGHLFESIDRSMRDFCESITFSDISDIEEPTTEELLEAINKPRKNKFKYVSEITKRDFQRMKRGIID